MADDDADEELLDLLRQSLANGLSTPAVLKSVVLEDAEFIYNNSIDVAVDMSGTKAAAESIYQNMQKQNYSQRSWTEQELHPKGKDAATVDFIFTMDLLNFSFWPDNPTDEPFAVQFGDQTWSGYSGLLAVLQRALVEG